MKPAFGMHIVHLANAGLLRDIKQAQDKDKPLLLPVTALPIMLLLLTAGSIPAVAPATALPVRMHVLLLTGDLLLLLLPAAALSFNVYMLQHVTAAGDHCFDYLSTANSQGQQCNCSLCG